jgi:hypothetical protein
VTTVSAYASKADGACSLSCSECSPRMPSAVMAYWFRHYNTKNDSAQWRNRTFFIKQKRPKALLQRVVGPRPLGNPRFSDPFTSFRVPSFTGDQMFSRPLSVLVLAKQKRSKALLQRVAGPGLAPGSGGYEPPEILLLHPAM